jgi:hypothetical protein
MPQASPTMSGTGKRWIGGSPMPKKYSVRSTVKRRPFGGQAASDNSWCPGCDLPSAVEPALRLIERLLFWLSVAASFLPLSTSPPCLVDANSDTPRPPQPLVSEILELLPSAGPNTLGPRSTKIVRTIGRLALMTHRQGSRLVQKKPMAMV